MKLIATCSVIIFLAGCESSKTSEKKPYRNTHTYDANGRYRNNDPRLYLGQSDLQQQALFKQRQAEARAKAEAAAKAKAQAESKN